MNASLKVQKKQSNNCGVKYGKQGKGNRIRDIERLEAVAIGEAYGPMGNVVAGSASFYGRSGLWGGCDRLYCQLACPERRGDSRGERLLESQTAIQEELSEVS